MTYKNCSIKSDKKLDRERFRQAVLEAAEAAGKQFGDDGLVSYLEAQAVATPSPFMTLLTKIISDSSDLPQATITKIEIVAPDHIGNATNPKTAKMIKPL